MNAQTKEPDLEMARAFNPMMRALAVFREELDTATPASYMHAFLLIALKPGKSVTEYAKVMGLAQPVTSRIMLEIGQKTRTGDPGEGLVESFQDVSDLRIKRYQVTAKGGALLKKLMRAMS